MISNWDKAFKQIIKSEGGFVNHPSDPGGMTNLGCTKKVWEEWVGHQVSEQDMRDLTSEKVAPLYKNRYWDRVKGDDLPTGLDYLLFDMAINAGPGRATKLLQTALGTIPDGAIGPNTMKLLHNANSEELIQKFSDEKEKFYKSLPTFPTFGKGWLNRITEVKTVATEMIG